MKSAQILFDNGIRSREQVIKACKLNIRQVELFDMWVNWQKDNSYDQGFVDGKRQIQSDIKKLLNIDEND